MSAEISTRVTIFSLLYFLQMKHLRLTV